MSMSSYNSRITLRPAVVADGDELRRLAELDSAETLTGTIFVAEIDGSMRAAYSLTERRATADPFHATANVLSFLRRQARAARLQPRRERRRARVLTTLG